ncbi:MAG: hypothetical protein Q8S94_05825 [Pseudohongiella sp.]|nr:hypothetical protein [Pseudohongiella sp.]
MTSRLVKVLLSSALVLGTLAACQSGYNPQPRAVMFPASEQLVLRSAAHWDALAANEAAAIWQLIPASSLVGLPQASTTHSPFEQAYRNMLTSHLVSNGLQLAVNPGSAVYQIDYDVQVIRHTERETLLPRPGVASAAFAIGAIGYSVGNWNNQGLAAIPLALGMEMVSLFWRDTSSSITEVLINSRVHDGVRLLAADSRVYYFMDEDQHNFTGGGRAFQVVSGNSSVNTGAQ